MLNNGLEWINNKMEEAISINDIKTILAMEETYVYSVYTDCIKMQSSAEWQENLNTSSIKVLETKYKKLLELRIFNKTLELRWKRTNLGKAFKYRCKKDEASSKSMLDEEYYFDKKYYLNIDTTSLRDGNRRFKPTSSQKDDYTFPVEIKTKQLDPDTTEKNGRTIAITRLIVRNYVGHCQDTMQAYIKDWRLVGFSDEEK